jgi:ATP/maltotriose-dependent transcriptional regulator MalT
MPDDNGQQETSYLPRPIHRARLVRPLPGPHLVSRDRLLARLDRADGGIVVINAPAGFGKTTLVVDWLGRGGTGYESAWLTLDTDDNDLVLLVTHLVAAIQSCEREFGARTLAHLEAADTPGVDALATAFGNEALDLPRPLTLVLDDTHVLVDSAALDFLDALMRYPPPSLRLVLCGRSELALALPTARGRGLVTDIRTCDLRLRHDEVARLLEPSTGESFAAEFVSAVTQRTDGWVACLSLLTAAIHQHVDRELFEADLLGHSGREIMDFLVTEVLANIRPETLAFLSLTAVCDRMCVDLADALVARAAPPPDSRDILEEMLRLDISVSRMRGDGAWYRFHPLFRDILDEQLRRSHGPAIVARQHARAAEWFAGHRMFEDAIRHALLADDAARAADLAVTVGPIPRSTVSSPFLRANSPSSRIWHPR